MFNSSKQAGSLRKLLTSYSSTNNRQTVFASASIPQHRRFLHDCIQQKWTKVCLYCSHCHVIFIRIWSYASNAIQVHLQILFVQATTQMNEKTLLTKLLRFCNWLLLCSCHPQNNVTLLLSISNLRALSLGLGVSGLVWDNLLLFCKMKPK